MSVHYTLERLREEIYKPVDGPRDPVPHGVTVAIVGAGPVGLTLANLLGARGIQTVVLEKNKTTSSLPKAIIIDDEYMRLLDGVDLSRAMARHVVGPVGINYFSPFGFRLARIPGGVTPNGFAGRSAMAQPMFEKVLLEGIGRFPCVSVCFDAELTELRQEDGSVRLGIRRGDGTASVLNADFVVACDGSHSFVRHQLGVPFVGAKLGNLRLVLDLAEFPDQDLDCRYLCNPSRPINSIPAPYGGRRIEVMLNNDEGEQAAATENVKHIIERYTPYSANALKIARAAVYDFSERVAERLSVGRVFLMGDAAHIMPPSGGQGLNTGGRDAANLAWKLDAVVRQRAGANILASYNEERWSHCRAVVDYAVKLGRFANLRSWPRALVRDLGFAIGRFVPALRNRLMQGDAPKPYYRNGLFVHDGAAAAQKVGRILPRLMLRDGAGRTRNIDEIVGQKFGLIGFNVTLAQLQRAAANSRLDLAIVSASLPAGGAGSIPAERDAFVLDDSARADWAHDLDGLAVFIRPDRYIAAVVRPDDVEGLIRRYTALPGQDAAPAAFASSTHPAVAVTGA